MASSISSSQLAPRKPEVSMHVCTPISLAPMRIRLANWGCMRTSPPDRVMPPFVVRKMRR